MDSTAMLLMNVAFCVMLAAMLVSFLRFLKGPTCADRMVALDAMTVIGISVIVMVALNTARIIYLDVALAYGLLSFLGGIAVARYLERGL